VDIPENAPAGAEHWAGGCGAGGLGAESGCHKKVWSAERQIGDSRYAHML